MCSHIRTIILVWCLSLTHFLLFFFQARRVKFLGLLSLLSPTPQSNHGRGRRQKRPFFSSWKKEGRSLACLACLVCLDVAQLRRTTNAKGKKGVYCGEGGEGGGVDKSDKTAEDKRGRKRRILSPLSFSLERAHKIPCFFFRKRQKRERKNTRNAHFLLHLA